MHILLGNGLFIKAFDNIRRIMFPGSQSLFNYLTVLKNTQDPTVSGLGRVKNVYVNGVSQGSVLG